MTLRRRSTTAALLPVLAVAVSLAILLPFMQLADPFVRHDDFPAVFGDEDAFYWKTLSEGRWLNYWWIARPVLWSTSVNYLIYLTGWATFAAAFAVAALGAGRARLMEAAALAALVVMTPMEFNIAQWFNTLIPAVWLLAAYALLNLFMSRRTAAVMMLVFVPLSYNAYTTYPFIILATFLMRPDSERSIGGLVKTLALFGLGLGLAMVATNTLNYFHHGVFGVEVADWRVTSEAKGIMDYVGNLGQVSDLGLRLLYILGFGSLTVGYAIFAIGAIGMLIVYRHDRMEGLFAVAAAVLGIGLLSVHSVLNGVFVPVRATIFLWLPLAYGMVRAASLLGTRRARLLTLQLGLFVMIGHLAVTRVDNYGYFQPWQKATRDFATRIPAGTNEIFVYGSYMSFEEAWLPAIQFPDGLGYRLRYLTGKPVTMCDDPLRDCFDIEPPFQRIPRFGSLLIETVDGVTYVRLPAVDRAP